VSTGVTKSPTTVTMSITLMDGNFIEYETISSSLIDRSGRGAIPHSVSGTVNIIILLYFILRPVQRRQKDETAACRITRNDCTLIHVLYTYIYIIFRYGSGHVTNADPYIIIIICFNPVDASCRSSE